MNLRTFYKLKKLGFDEDWLLWIKNNWAPRKIGKYEMLITEIEELDDDPAEGIYIERTRFDNDDDLPVIHHFFEGQAYVMTVVETGDVIGGGIIDGSPFEECELYEYGDEATWDKWNWKDCDLETFKKEGLK